MNAPEDLLRVSKIQEAIKPSDGLYHLPNHFTEVALSQNGGATLRDDSGQIVAECFPIFKNGRKGIVIRTEVTGTNLVYQVRNLFPWAEFVQIFSPAASFKSTNAEQLEVVKIIDGFMIAHPNRVSAQQTAELQRLIWGTTSVYPTDLYDQESPAATKLVAIKQDQVIGFLLGFWGIKDTKLWLESQILGVHPNYRKRGVARILKEQQRLEALEQGIEVIHWTVDPLQCPNAYLNFNSLGAVATAFDPDHYGFTNQLNLVSASRFKMTYLTSPEVLNKLNGIFGEEDPEPTYVLAPDWQVIDAEPQADLYLEVPADWSELQRTSLDEAMIVRKKTDQLFVRLIGCAEKKYVIGRIKEVAGHFFLVAKEYSKLKDKLGENLE